MAFKQKVNRTVISADVQADIDKGKDAAHAHANKTLLDTLTQAMVDVWNARTAVKLATARNINGVAFDGTTDVTIADATKEPMITKNAAFNKNYETVSTNIKMDGTRAVGTADTIARGDHIHPTDTSRAASSHTHAVSDITSFASTVLGGVLTSLSTATNAVITSADTILSALGKLQKQISDNLSMLTTHIGNTSNPHSTTAAQLGLGNVTNESKTTILASPALTGTPTAPTATTGTNTTQVASTAFVQAALGASGGGDMLKSVYDTAGNGTVDNAEKVNGLTVQTAVPSGAVFTDTVTTINGKTGAIAKADILAVTGAPSITVGTTAPSLPALNDIWIDTN